MKKSIKFKILIIMLFALLCLIIGGKNVNAATNHNQIEAINWATNKGDIKWNVDVDGEYGCQCVDLILAYYDYLAGYHTSGNACDYTWNDLPAGWTRVYDSPREGDIVVWKPGAAMGWSPLITCNAHSKYGHIGIVWKVNDYGTIGTIETNGGNGSAAGYYERYPNNVACYIRPDFKNIKDDLAPIKNFGDNFYAYLIMSSNWDLFNVDVDSTVLLQKGVWQDPKQIWNFNRQSDGSYTIKNASTGKYLDVCNSNDWDGGVIQTSGYNGGASQRFFLSGTQDKCILRPACSSVRVVSVDGGHNLEGKKLNMWEYWGVETQFFNVWKVDEAKSSSLNYTVNGNNVNLNWTKGENASKYNIIIKAGTSGNVKNYKKIVDIAETSYKINLPAGYYEVTVEGWNYFSHDFSNVVKFTISENKTDIPFNDVKSTDWFFDAIKYTYKSDIIKGVNETEFKPNTKLSRGMLVTILWRMEGSPKVTTNTSFPDVKSTEYYSTPIKWAASKGIVSGYSSGKFGPNDNITREQVAVILRKYAKYKGKNVSSLANISSYKDASKVSSYAKTEVQWAIASGIISGKDNGTKIDPQGSASRAEAASMIYNYCKKIK